MILAEMKTARHGWTITKCHMEFRRPFRFCFLLREEIFLSIFCK